MSLQELPGSFGVIFQAFSLPMEAERSRNKKRLEASLAGLCELELLKQRQECRVLSALCLGDSTVTGRPPWGTRRSARCALDASDCNASHASGPGLQINSLHCTPWGIKSSLEQQVAELKVNTEVKSAELRPDLEDKRLNSGETLVTRQNGSLESNYNPLSPRSLSATEGTGETETRESWHSDTRRKATVTDVLREMKDVNSSLEDCQQAQKLETYIFGLIQCRALPIRPSKPHTSLTHYARAVTVVRQSSLCCKEEQHSPKQVSVQLISTLSHCSEGTVPKVYHNPDQEHYLELELNEEEVPPPYHHHLLQSVQYQPRFIRKPMQASMVSMSGSTSPDYTSCSMLQANKDSNNSETDSPQHFLNYQAVPVHSKPHHPPSLDEQLVNAEYIPANPCRASTRAFAHHHSNPHKGSGVPKPNKSMFSPEQSHHNEEQQPTVSQILPSRCRGGAKKCHLSEDRICASRKTGKKAGRSQSGNSQQRVPERKYNTVERDGGGSGSGGRGSCNSQSRSKKQQQGSGSYRRWQSSLELSQDEADQPPMQPPMQGSSASNQSDQCARKTLKSRSSHASHAYPHRNHHHPQSQHHQDMECHLERDKVPLCKPSEDYPHQGRRESESSMSEADSPDSSSLSSDSDESGGLVWPQQLPPQLSLPSPLAPPGATMQPKAFVKIKASHALKKKILRFRTGSLKVMTTV
ncbi:dapper 1-A-like [Scophthalmus maximus]|uniref:dapper 1-A-like n=1 Tax=Scophthalmus maximus TaxID=52904 RepID=UPI0015E0D83B|nr:dapper 1-A-like [Scophthalmus maximus]